MSTTSSAPPSSGGPSVPSAPAQAPSAPKGPPEYGSFAPTDDEYAFHDIYHTHELTADTSEEFMLSITLYRGIPDGLSVDEAPDDGYRFVNLGKYYNRSYMGEPDLKNRLSDKQLASDYEALKNGETNIILTWNKGGRKVGMPGGLVQALNDPKESFASWSARQRASWPNVVNWIGDNTPPADFDVLSRFIQPAADSVELVFTPSEDGAALDLATLKTYVQAAVDAGKKESSTGKSPIPYAYRIISYKEANDDPTLKLLSWSFLDYFCTWISPTTYDKLCAKTKPFLRPWPTEAMCDDIDKALHGTGPSTSGNAAALITNVIMSNSKSRGARSKRAEVPGQATIMGASATLAAEKFWDKKSLTPGKRPADSEWLHRNAFHFGGLKAGVDLLSSQTRENLVFGTGESNTDMIRAENVVSNILKQFPDDKGVLSTFNITTGSVNRMNSLCASQADAIPAWVNAKMFMWLSMELKYEFKMKVPSINFDCSHSTTFDPFSRYIPFRVEAWLDGVIFKAIAADRYTASVATTTSTPTAPLPTVPTPSIPVPVVVSNPSAPGSGAPITAPSLPVVPIPSGAPPSGPTVPVPTVPIPLAPVNDPMSDDDDDGSSSTKKTKQPNPPPTVPNPKKPKTNN